MSHCIIKKKEAIYETICLKGETELKEGFLNWLLILKSIKEGLKKKKKNDPDLNPIEMYSRLETFVAVNKRKLKLFANEKLCIIKGSSIPVTVKGLFRQIQNCGLYRSKSSYSRTRSLKHLFGKRIILFSRSDHGNVFSLREREERAVRTFPVSRA